MLILLNCLIGAGRRSQGGPCARRFVSTTRDFGVNAPEASLTAGRPLAGGDVEAFEAWAATYQSLREKTGAEGQLIDLGRALYRWLDGNERWLEALLPAADPPLIFEFQALGTTGATARAFLQAPWELLAEPDGGFLAGDAIRLYCPLRRLGRAVEPAPPGDLCLGLAFMAAAPRNVLPVLDYEKEETAILEAAGSLGLDLVVEESGNPDLLAERLAELAAMQVLHLSCHGERTPEPMLLLEDEAGGRLDTKPVELVRSIRARLPRLAFVSACYSAASGPLAGPLAMTLAQAGVPAVLGWDGSVYDREAIAFAQDLYKSLVRRLPLEEAVAEARLALLAAGGPKPSRDWHLARLWLGARGGGPLVGGARRRQMLSAEHGHKEFLDKRKQKLPVASRDAFVGRRRELQTALAVLREGKHAGLLIHGMGRLGKSSLAARIAHRRPDLTPVVVFERYDALTIADDLALAVPEAAAAIEGERARLFDAPEALEGLLRRLLEGPCQQKATGKPILLVIDDLERLLDEPTDGAGLWRAKEAHRKVLRAVLRAFAHASTHSRLMLTSRYRFTLPDGADDLAARLHPLQLAPMDEAGARKQALRRLEAEPAAGEAAEEQRSRLAQRAIAAARGSPGLLDLLFDLIETNADQAVRALDDMQRYLDEGAEPSDSKVLAFLQDLLLDRLLELAGPGGEALLRAAMIFALPVPAAVVRSLAAADGGDVERLQALGLLDTYEDLADPASAGARRQPTGPPQARPVERGGDGGARPWCRRIAVPCLGRGGPSSRVRSFCCRRRGPRSSRSSKAVCCWRRRVCCKAAASSMRPFSFMSRFIGWIAIAAMNSTRQSSAVRSPTSCRPAASSTRPCASAARSSCRSTSGWATCARGR